VSHDDEGGTGTFPGCVRSVAGVLPVVDAFVLSIDGHTRARVNGAVVSRKSPDVMMVP
jgi:hypothetical protein